MLVEVSDLHGLTASQIVTITVVNIDVTATITNVTGDLQEGSQVTVHGVGSDPSGNATTITLTYEVLLDGQLVASDSGVDLASLAFVPPDQGDYVIRLTATGNNGESESASRWC